MGVKKGLRHQREAGLILCFVNTVEPTISNHPDVRLRWSSFTNSNLTDRGTNQDFGLVDTRGRFHCSKIKPELQKFHTKFTFYTTLSICHVSDHRTCKICRGNFKLTSCLSQRAVNTTGGPGLEGGVGGFKV